MALDRLRVLWNIILLKDTIDECDYIALDI